MDSTTFWTRVKSLIKDKNTTQRALSVDIGLNPRTIETWINQGTIPNIFQAHAIAEKLGVSLEYLATGSEPQNGKLIPDDLQEVIDKYSSH